MNHKIHLCCPYCDKRFEVEPPLDEEIRKGPSELYNLPYTRDIGKFDPKPEEDIYAAERWSRIGKDYLPFINFERFGILRISQKGINVRYRAQKCVECENLFDVFANYSKGKTLEQIWPHLFSRDAGSGGVKLYKGENLIIRFVRSSGERLKSNFVGIFLFCLMLFLAGWIPYLLINQSKSCSASNGLNFRLSEFLLINIPKFTNPLVSELGLNQCGTVLIASAFILYISASLGIMFLLISFENYLSYLQNSTDFDDLFRLTIPKNGVNFWKNYIASRFVGVQQNKGFFPQLTQSDIFAGGISLILALASWGMEQRLPFIKAIEDGNFNIALFLVVELFFWLIIIYFLSIAIFLSLSLTSYVLNGIRKIPMNITPYDNFSSAKPLKVMEAYAVNIMLVCFIVILLVLSMLQIAVHIQWVLIWFELALAFLFIAVGLGSTRNEYIIGAFLYLLFLYLLRSAHPLRIDSLGLIITKGIVSQSTNSIPIVDLGILVLGFFLTGALAFQLYSADQYINNLLVNSKNSAVKVQKKQLELLQKNLDALNERITGQNPGSPASNKLLNDYQSQRYSVLSSIEATIRVIDHLEKIELKRNPFTNITKALTPLTATLLFSIVQTAVLGFIFPEHP